MEWPCLQNVCSIIMHLAFLGGDGTFWVTFQNWNYKVTLALYCMGVSLCFFMIGNKLKVFSEIIDKDKNISFFIEKKEARLKRNVFFSIILAKMLLKRRSVKRLLACLVFCVLCISEPNKTAVKGGCEGVFTFSYQYDFTNTSNYFQTVW